MARITRERYKTYENVFDNHTEKVLVKLSSQGHFDTLSPLSIGKESNVFIGSNPDMPRIVKIYRLEACDFNQMYTYIRTDPRYLHLKGQKRKVIFSWTQREYRNIMICRLHGVRVPTPYTFLSNIFIQEFIGDIIDGRPVAAPKLKDMIPENPDSFYAETVRQMELIAKAGLVHGDLSQFNILNHHEKPVIIDMSQSTMTENPLYEDLLRRDCKNISAFFRKYGVESDETKLFKHLSSIKPIKEKISVLN